MALSSEVDDAIDLLVLNQLVEGLEVADIHLHEFVVGLALYVLEVGQVASVGQLVEVDDVVVGIFIHKKANNVRADKTCTACDYNIMHNIRLISQSIQFSNNYYIEVYHSLTKHFIKRGNNINADKNIKPYFARFIKILLSFLSTPATRPYHAMNVH